MFVVNTLQLPWNWMNNSDKLARRVKVKRKREKDLTTDIRNMQSMITSGVLKSHDRQIWNTGSGTHPH